MMKVGDVAKALGLSIAFIRYYVDAGILKPERNVENNYLNYTNDDLIKITDILFYRSMGLSTKEIKSIMCGKDLSGINNLIETKKINLIKEIKTATDKLATLAKWSETLKAEIALLDKFEIGDMPPVFRRDCNLDISEKLNKYIEGNFHLDKNDWGYVSVSFVYDMYAENPKAQYYLSIDGSRKISPSNMIEQGVEEKVSNCLITESVFSNDIKKMIEPMLEYAKISDINLSGIFYGRENTNYYEGRKRCALYKIYAPIIK